MANLSKIKRDRMLNYIEQLKNTLNNDDSIIALNEIENALKEKKFGLVFEEHTEEIDELLKDNIPVFVEDKERILIKNKLKHLNFLIEGDNLQALVLLEKTLRGRVDCIYIDPPYNSGAHDWKYNNDYVDKDDSYRHSKWLSLMKRRLQIAKKLLNPQSSCLIVTIDEKEYLHLGLLLEDLFPTANIQMISTIINLSGTGRVNEFTRTNEYIYFVRIGDCKIYPIIEQTSENRPITWAHLHRSEISNGRSKTKAQFYPIFVDDKTLKIVSVGEPLKPEQDRHDIVAPQGCTAVFPVRDDEIETMWGCTGPELLSRIEKGYVRVGQYRPNHPQKYAIGYLKTGTIKDIENGNVVVDGYDKRGAIIAHYESGKKRMPTTVMNNPLYDANRYGTKVVTTFLGPGKFSYPKSLYAVEDCLRFVLGSKKDAIILDFFAGSGTTQHAVNLMNAIDNGNRKCIMVTNNEISEQEEKEFAKQGIHKGDPEWESKGIARYITWPRTVCSINGVDVQGKVPGDVYERTGIPYAQGFDSNIKYLKCEWAPRRPEDHLLSNALCLHIKEMLELQCFEEIDNIRNILILNKNDYVNYIKNGDPKTIKKVWVNQNIVFSNSELTDLKKYKFKFIPKEFFGEELKEAGE